MIVSTKILESIKHIAKIEYFQSSYSRRIAQWILDYYEMYDEAPGRQIQDIYEKQKESLKEEEADLIAIVLKKLNDVYLDGGKINDDFYLDEAARYFKSREIKLRSDEALRLIELGKIEEAESQLVTYKEVAKNQSTWVDPFASDYIEKIMREEEREEVFFKFPGQLGEMIGPLERGYFMAIMGPYKRGKTWWLGETAYQALLQRLKVAYISLEMKHKTMSVRIYKRILARAEESGVIVYPVFDCRLNQEGTCDSPNRKNKVTLSRNGVIPEYSPNLSYRACDFCRKNFPSQYEMKTWFDNKNVEPLDSEDLKVTSDDIRLMYGGRNLRIKSYPRFSATLEDIKRDLAILRTTEGFIPDVVVIDYLDILKPTNQHGEERFKLDDLWKTAAGIGEEMHVLMVTATQTNRDALEVRTVSQKHVAELAAKIGHVDLMITLNQTALEARAGIMRIGLLVHRHRDMMRIQECTVLQSLSMGQPLLDVESGTMGDE